ncbi:MAG TPA: L-serine ammonia-lyase, iron-sulfur-dependent, subunit alpha [Tepiditoga sp.]|nr:L-serine ammonia-lyase, iron-sulfur-dependent, subunit alpha [Tepiditoga sp.]
MFSNFSEIIDLCDKTNKDIYEIIMEWEVMESGNSREDIMENAYVFVNQMILSYKEKIDNLGQKSLTGWTGYNTELYLKRIDSGKSLFGNLMSKSILVSLATSENNATMGRIVACPTAGSSGVIPGVIVSLYEDRGFSFEEISRGLIIAGAVGEFIKKRIALAGAVGGCQAEIGSATAMGAAAATYILGGTPSQISNAAALALKFLMGLVCDPVGGFVEVPCVKRNPAGSILAFTATELALSGIESKIPFDEVASAMGKVGRSLNEDLRETGRGGIAGTKTAKKLLSDFSGNKI